MKQDSIRISLTPGLLSRLNCTASLLNILAAASMAEFGSEKTAASKRRRFSEKDVLTAMAKDCPTCHPLAGRVLRRHLPLADESAKSSSHLQRQLRHLSDEDNSFGTDEFMRLCELDRCKNLLNINMLSAVSGKPPVWAEYCNREEETALSVLRRKNGHPKPYQVQLWGIGNEVWQAAAI